MTQPKRGMDWKRALSTSLFVVLVALLAWYVYENRADMARLLALSAGDVTLMLALALGGCVMNCVYHRLILSTYHIPLDAVDWMGGHLRGQRHGLCAAHARGSGVQRGLLQAHQGTGICEKREHGGGEHRLRRGVCAGADVCFAPSDGDAGRNVVRRSMAPQCGPWARWRWPDSSPFSLLVQGRGARAGPGEAAGRVVRGFNALLKNRWLLWRLLACLVVNNAVQLSLYMACFGAIGMPVTVYQALFL